MIGRSVGLPETPLVSVPLFNKRTLVPTQLTWGRIGKGEPDLVHAHDPIRVRLGVDLGHCKAVTVLYSAICKGDADNLALRDRLQTHDNLFERDGFLST